MTRPTPTVLLLLGIGNACAPEPEVEKAFPHSLVSVLDQNGDQQIDQQEFGAVAEQGVSFDEYDKDLDGQIDASELMRSLLSKSPSRGKTHRHHDPTGDRSWAAWEMHAKRNGLAWGAE